MTTQSKPYSRVAFLINTFADWLKHCREIDEIRRLDRAEFDRIAADLEISPGDLDEVVRRGLNASEELPLLLKAIGIDEAKLGRIQPLALRDMRRVCALCSHKIQCDRDLVAGSAAEHYRKYCPNAPTIGELGEMRAQ